MTKELLLEIGVEEVPAGMLEPAFADIVRLATESFAANRIAHGAMLSTGTPRRIVLSVKDVAERQPDLDEVKQGPPVSSAFDKDGKPKPAAEGFAQKMGLTVDQLERVATPKGEYLVAKRTIPGGDTMTALAGLLPEIIKSIPWRKSMRWADGDMTFVRPIKWIVALMGGKIIDFTIEGAATGNKTRGHRFLSPDEIEVSGFDDYVAKLRKASVVVDHRERRKVIEEEVRSKAKELGGSPASFDTLFDEVSFITELPVVVTSSFPEKFLKVPKEALIASMVGHQRYFPIVDSNGALKNHFISIANTPARDISVVAKGNARVLNARLSDAEYFYNHDLAKPLADRVEALKGMIYLKDLGSYYDKAVRTESLAGIVAGWIGKGDAGVAKAASRAALLAKADLTTTMVGEFPSLQGTMGGIYAGKTGETDDVAKAIEEHYLPRSTGDIDNGILPKSLAGACVAIADRADSLAACFGMGLIPKGNQDPYALRRAVLGILAIVRKLSLRIPLGKLIAEAVKGVEGKVKRPTAELENEITAFVRERVLNQISGAGMTGDTAEAVVRSGLDDFLDVWDKALALTEFRKRPDFEDLAVGFRRLGNILEGIQKNAVDESLFTEAAEKELWKAYSELKGKVEDRAKNRDYAGALAVMAELRPQVDKFFDDVLVNDPKDAARKVNRHSLLYAVHRLFLNVADFSALSR